MPSHWARSSKAPLAWSVMLSVTILKFLIISPLNLHVVTEVNRTTEHTQGAWSLGSQAVLLTCSPDPHGLLPSSEGFPMACPGPVTPCLPISPTACVCPGLAVAPCLLKPGCGYEEDPHVAGNISGQTWQRLSPSSAGNGSACSAGH